MTPARPAPTPVVDRPYDEDGTAGPSRRWATLGVWHVLFASLALAGCDGGCGGADCADGLALEASRLDDGGSEVEVRVVLRSERDDSIPVAPSLFELETVDGLQLPVQSFGTDCVVGRIVQGGTYRCDMSYGDVDGEPVAVVFRSAGVDGVPIVARAELAPVEACLCPDASTCPEVCPPPGPCVDATDRVDLLLVLDNTASMIEERAALASALPGLLFDLVQVRGVESLQVGVITTDMGSGGILVPTCDGPRWGNDGVLRAARIPTPSGCSETRPPFLEYGAGGATIGELTPELQCLIDVGAEGCGFEQPLEASLKALSPLVAQPWTAPGYAAPAFELGSGGHGDAANAGFVRSDAVLAVVVVSDEDDCSVHDPRLFDPASTVYREELNLRCVLSEDEALHPLSRYVDGLLALRSTAHRLVYGPIVGIPSDLEPHGAEPVDFGVLVDDDLAIRDDRMEIRLASSGARLMESCAAPGRGDALPPLRTVRVGQQLERRGAHVTVRSLCTDDLDLGPIADRIGDAMRSTCM